MTAHSETVATIDTLRFRRLIDYGLALTRGGQWAADRLHELGPGLYAVGTYDRHAPRCQCPLAAAGLRYDAEQDERRWGAFVDAWDGAFLPGTLAVRVVA